ncbi:unnamed protein product [Nesidiocoris tenuis]|uniref:Uncharacterized protein n=1 Tax=Nesidiocoris tenuis TaxID=355587 RepID=A0A6H5FYP7_9HEMI|nr:unnamed protein product [Nesidiocoris tenuis]
MASSTSRFFGKCALNVSRRRFSAGPVPKMRKSAKERARSIGCAATAGLVAWSYVRYFDLDVVYASKSKKALYSGN